MRRSKIHGDWLSPSSPIRIENLQFERFAHLQRTPSKLYAQQSSKLDYIARLAFGSVCLQYLA